MGKTVERDYFCPKCLQTYTYTAIEYQYSKEDGCCHECAPTDPDAIPYTGKDD
jgi:hypothetical protein